jgi:hypothetical protein
LIPCETMIWDGNRLNPLEVAYHTYIISAIGTIHVHIHRSYTVLQVGSNNFNHGSVSSNPA